MHRPIYFIDHCPKFKIRQTGFKVDVIEVGFMWDIDRIDYYYGLMVNK